MESVTSRRLTWIRSATPASPAALSRASAFPVSRMVAMVAQPARAVPMAAARPMPEDVPVIRTVFGEVMRVFLAWEQDGPTPVTGEFPSYPQR